jgi:hypothetical protein
MAQAVRDVLSRRLDDARQGPAMVAALRLAGAGPVSAILAWVVLAVAAVGLRLAAEPLGLPTDTEQAYSPGFWIYEAAGDAMVAVAAGVALHAMLLGRAPDLRRPGVLAFMGLMFAMELFWSGAYVLLFEGIMRAGDPDPTIGSAAAKLVSWAAVAGFPGFFFARLLLWPIGLLIGEPDLTPRRSWARMRGWTVGYIGAWLGLFMGIAVVALGPDLMIERFAGRSETTAAHVANIVMNVILAAALTALSAVAYERRASSKRLADVFD